MRSPFPGLFDDAALFPPGEAPMAAAVPAHRELRARLGDHHGFLNLLVAVSCPTGGAPLAVAGGG